jgi:5-methylcytosine-specific restriction endonuclease McrA
MHIQRDRVGKSLTDPPRVATWRGVTCRVRGCDLPAKCRGMCSLHEQRDRRGVPLDRPIEVKNLGQACSVDGCDTASRKRGWCPKHYERWMKHGDVTVVIVAVRKTGCSVADCERPYAQHDLCMFHFRRKQRGTPFDAPVKVAKSPECCVEGCEKPGQRRGMCHKHRQREEYQENPARAAAIKAKVKRRLFNAARGMDDLDKEISTAYWAAIQGDPCFYCGGEFGEVDHFFPVSKDGTDHWWNLRPACARCNRVKWARCGTWFMLKRGDVRGPGLPAAVA